MVNASHKDQAFSWKTEAVSEFLGMKVLFIVPDKCDNTRHECLTNNTSFGAYLPRILMVG